MNTYERMIRAFEIFNSYPGDHSANLAAEHDEMWAGPAPEDVSVEHFDELTALGWRSSDGCFHRFV